jgi:hypothetical protein
VLDGVVRRSAAGLTQCALCGGSLVVRNRGLKSGRSCIYVCGCHYLRGPAACTNDYVVSMEDADREVLAKFEKGILLPEVVERAVLKTITRLRPAAEGVAQQKDAVKSKLTRLESELTNLATAIASGGQLSSVLAALKDRETLRDRAREELRLLDQTRTANDFNPQELRKELGHRLTDWQGLLRREPQHSRRILKRLLLGKLVFMPREDEKGRYYEFTGKGTLAEILDEIACTKGWVSPGGYALYIRRGRLSLSQIR